MSKLTENGVSTTKGNGEFKYEEFYSSVLKKHKIAWDYRDTNGVLHSGVANTVEEAKLKASQYGYSD